MKQKFSTIFLLLLLFLAGSRVVAQNAPKPFDIEQPSLREFPIHVRRKGKYEVLKEH